MINNWFFLRSISEKNMKGYIYSIIGGPPTTMEKLSLNIPQTDMFFSQ
jgi:hypothetical protein